MIGIVGGVGPYAGIDLLKKVYDNTIADSDQEHLDTALLSMSSSIKDRTAFLSGEISENPAFAIAEVLLKLESIGATVAGIPCNTAHSEGIYDVVADILKKRDSRLKLLNMIEETVSFIARNYAQVSAVGVLSTTGTYKSGVYSKALQQKNYKVVLPPMEMQEKLIHTAIYDAEYGIKAHSNPVHPQAVHNLHQGILYLKEQGAQAVILGCTEIPLAIPEKEAQGLTTIDPTGILARALIKNYQPQKLKQLQDLL